MGIEVDYLTSKCEVSKSIKTFGFIKTSEFINSNFYQKPCWIPLVEDLYLLIILFSGEKYILKEQTAVLKKPSAQLNKGNTSNVKDIPCYW